MKTHVVRNLGLCAWLVACGSPEAETEPRDWPCELEDGDADFVQRIGCLDDFTALSSEPLDSSIPGSRSVKTVVDRDDGALYFQHSERYPVHYDFVSEHLSGDGRRVVPPLSQFNQTEYYSQDRRFLLGAVTHYEQADQWVYEISPYDNATADMIQTAFDAIADSAYFGPVLAFHPTSDSVERAAAELDESVPVISTDALYEGIDFQALNLGRSLGYLRFVSAEDLETQYVGFRDIVVLDGVPNDISVVSGIITDEFQTPLSHINVLSQNRGTPNMGLRNAFDNEQLRALEGKWVELEVDAFGYSVQEVSVEEADAFWEEHRPEQVQVPNLDLETTELRDVVDMIDPELPLREAIRASIPAYGGKASHYGALALIDEVPSPKAFGIPVYYYRQFMEQNDFDERVAAMLEDPEFQNDPAVRDEQLRQLRQDMHGAPVDSEFEQMLLAKLDAEYKGIRMRFRSSTNAEDLEGFTGAGLYTSKSGEPGDPYAPVLDAIREVWASVWFFRAFEERSFRGIDHQNVGMALLVHNSFPAEEVNGVALTANPFDTSGLEPGFYINVQAFEVPVVAPPPGVVADQFIYHFDQPGQPVVFISHSNVIPSGETVLTRAQTHELGQALEAIHQHFRPAYGPSRDDPSAWYAMEVEFKFDGEPGEEPALWVKQARPHPGRGQL